VNEGTFLRKRIDKTFRLAGFYPKEIMEVTNALSAVQLAAAGIGYTIAPERAMLALGGFEKFNCYLYGERQDFWDVSAVYREDVYLDKAERTLIDMMKDVFGSRK
jgi:DNA-binding transcriptional LysR family regulator